MKSLLLIFSLLVVVIAAALTSAATNQKKLDHIFSSHHKFDVGATTSSYPPPRCPNPPNAYPVNEDEPVLIRSVKNGQLYQAGQKSMTFYVQHVYGDFYDMGYAHGQLNKDVIPIGINGLYEWIVKQAEQKVPWLPTWLMHVIVDAGAYVALEMTWNNTVQYCPSRYVLEMNGLADGAGMKRQDIYNVNMLAELIKAQCSIILASEGATADSLRGALVHLRTLDGMGGDTMPIKDYSLVNVYHPINGEPAQANVAWISFVGTVTGFGEYVSIGEKYWGSGKKYNKNIGEAWTFVTRDMLAARSFEEARDILQNASRTCSVHLGVGGLRQDGKAVDGAMHKARVFETSGDIFLELNDRSVVDQWHPYLPGIIYFDMFGQPSHSYCFGDMLTRLYGNITAEQLAVNVAARLGTGDLHAAVFDWGNYHLYFAVARATTVSSGPMKACHRQFTKLDMKKLFAHKMN